MCVAQEQALRINVMKNDIDHQNVSPLYRLYKEKVKNVTHIVSSFSVLAGNQYMRRHGKLGLENDKFKILWGFTIQTDTEIEH